MGVLKPRPEIFKENFYRLSPSINSGRKFCQKFSPNLLTWIRQSLIYNTGDDLLDISRRCPPSLKAVAGNPA